MSEGFPKTALKTPEQQLIELKELQHSLAEAREAQDAPAAEALMKDNWDLVFSREASDLSFGEAERLFGRDFFGPKAIERIFGKKPESIPNIPFTKEDLERAKELGQQLIFYTDVMAGETPSGPVTLENLKRKFQKAHDGNPTWYSQDWYNDEDFFKKEKPRTGWRLTSKDLIPNSTSKNYLEQTDVLIEHLQNAVYKGTRLPIHYEDAIAEFKRKRAEIEPLAKSSTDAEWKKGSKMLADLAITRLVRELPVETMYRLIVNDQGIKDKPLPSTYTWTASRTSGGGLVFVGSFDAEGASVNGRGPRDSYGLLGVSFSRS